MAFGLGGMYPNHQVNMGISPQTLHNKKVALVFPSRGQDAPDEFAWMIGTATYDGTALVIDAGRTVPPVVVHESAYGRIRHIEADEGRLFPECDYLILLASAP